MVFRSAQINCLQQSVTWAHTVFMVSARYKMQRYFISDSLGKSPFLSQHAESQVNKELVFLFVVEKLDWAAHSPDLNLFQQHLDELER